MVQDIEISDDEITKLLNKRLDDEARGKKVEEEVEKRYLKHQADEDKKAKELEVHEATFTDDTDEKKKKVVKVKTVVECASCGSEDTVKISDDDDTYFYKKRDVKEVWQCNRCRRRTGVAI